MGYKRHLLAGIALGMMAARVAAAPMEPIPVVSLSPTTLVSSTYSVVITSPIVAHATASWRIASPAPFFPGEDLQFSIKWGIVVGGYSTLSIPEIVDVNGRPTYHIISTARSGGVVTAFYKVEDKNDVWLDRDALVTVRYEKRIREGRYRIEETSLLDQIHLRWTTRSFRLDRNSYEEKSGDLPANALDSFGSLYYVRTLPLEPGQSHTIDVHSGDKVYPLVVNVIKRETVKVPAGRFNCVLVEPILRGPGIFISKGKKLQVWITDDARRMPVRMRSEVFIGHVSAELTDFKTGR